MSRNVIDIPSHNVRIICGDVIEEMEKLNKNGAKFDCIFADPDYNVGIRYGSKTYNVKFNEYIEWTVGWSEQAYKLLKEKGNLFIINYPKNNAHLRVKYLDGAFYGVQDYSWVYNTNVGHSARKFTRAHRSILHCTKSKNNNFYKDNVAMSYKNPNDKRVRGQIKKGSKGRMPYSWFYFDMVKNVSKDKTSHPCQIPLGLSEMLVASCTNPGDKVLILFSGSGNDVISALRLKNKVTAIDIDEMYCRLVEERVKDMGI